MNPHAILITLLMSAILEVKKTREVHDADFQLRSMREGGLKLAQYEAIIRLSLWPKIRDTVCFAALNHVLDNESLFEE